MTHVWNEFQQAQIPADQSLETSNVKPLELEDSIDIEQLIGKESLKCMMDLPDIAASDMKDFESGSQQPPCYDSAWIEAGNLEEIGDIKLDEKNDCSGNALCSDVQSTLQDDSDRTVLEPSCVSNDVLDAYSDISSCSETEVSPNCNLSLSIEDNLAVNKLNQSVEEKDPSSSDAMHFLSFDGCQTNCGLNINNTNQSDNSPSNQHHMATDTCNEENTISVSDSKMDSVVTNVVEEFVENVKIQDETLKRHSHDSEHSVDQDMVESHEISVPQNTSICVLNEESTNGDQSSSSRFGQLSSCQLETTDTGPESDSPDIEKTTCKLNGKDVLDSCLSDGKLKNIDFETTTSECETLEKSTFGVTSHLDQQKLLDQSSSSGFGQFSDCQLETTDTGPESDFPDIEKTTCKLNGKDVLDLCQSDGKLKNVDFETTTSESETLEKSTFGVASHLDQQKLLEQQTTERSSFGFLESCFGLKSTDTIDAQQDVKLVNQNDDIKDQIVIQTTFDPSKISKDQDAPQNPVNEFVTCQTFKRPLQNTTAEPVDGVHFSFTKVSTKKLQPVVVLKSTEPKTNNGLFFCADCPNSAQSLDEIIEHFHFKHSSNSIRHCPSCDCYFSSDKMAKHFCGNIFPQTIYTRKKVVTSDVFLCKYCTRSFIKQKCHAFHEQRHINVTDHKCSRCGLYFPTNDKCETHRRKNRCPKVLFTELSKLTITSTNKVLANGGLNLEVPNCFVKLVDIRTKAQSPEPIKCHLCEKTFRFRAQLKAHLGSHSSDKPYKCERCDQAFKYTWNLSKHKRDQCSHSTEPIETISVPASSFEAKYKCPLCVRVFKYSYNRTRHLREQCLKEYTRKGKGKVGGKYCCPLCKDIFTMSCNRNRHIKNTCLKLKFYSAKVKIRERHEKQHKSPANTLPRIKHRVGAKMKGLLFNEQNATKSESSKEDPEISFSCRFCGKPCHTAHALTKHLQQHKGNKPFRCLDCGKTFSRHGHLLSHKRVHKRKIQCSICRKVLSSIGDLLKHRRSHSDKGMLQCPYCPMKFKFPVFFLRHVPVHERNRNVKSHSPAIQPKPTHPPNSHLKNNQTTQTVEAVFKEEFSCALCNKVFSDSSELSKHCLTHMPGPAVCKCQICAKSFCSRAALIRHIRLHTGEKPFQCQQCRMYFQRKEQLKLHFVKCNGVPVQTSSVEEVSNEATTNTSIKKPKYFFNCSYCPHSFSSLCNLKLHEKAHLAKTLFRCLKCGKYYRKRKIKFHESNCAGKELNPSCRKCGKPFARRNYRNAHEKNCSGIISSEMVKSNQRFKHKCPQCPKSFRSSIFLFRHLKEHSKEKQRPNMHMEEENDISQKKTRTPVNKKEEFKCKFCTKSFSRARSLRCHVLGHTEVKPYKCKMCDNSFSRYDHLELHQGRCRGKGHFEVQVGQIRLDNASPGSQSEIKLENETFQCEVCFKQFFASRSLNRHMSMVHIVDKPHPCQKCGKTYSTLKSLRAHNCKTQIASKESVQSPKKTAEKSCRETSKLLQRIQVHYMKPMFRHQCMFCQRRFKISAQLKLHLRLHTGEKPYGCDNCGERFIRTDYLKRHLTKCSGKEESQEVTCDKCGNLFSTEALLFHKKKCAVKTKSTGSSLEVDAQKRPQRTRSFSCGVCSERFLLFSQLQHHFLAKHRADNSPEPKNCQQNDKVLKKEPINDNHRQNVSPMPNQNSSTDLHKPLTCPECNMQFISNSGLGMHMRIHSGGYPFSCKKCSAGAWSKKSLQKHIKKCRRVIANNKSIQESASELESSLNDTVLLFNNDSNATGTGVLQTKFLCKDQDKENGEDKQEVKHKYQCSECDQSFTDGLVLISHLEEHGRTGQKQDKKDDKHRCLLCGKVFGKAELLKKHLKVQHNTKAVYTCPACLKSFRFPSDLETHKACHDPNRPFSCSMCTMRFWSDKSLSRHQKVHAEKKSADSKLGTKPETIPPTLYRCEPCDKTYTIKRSYLKHCQTKHRADSDKDPDETNSKYGSDIASPDSEEDLNRNLEDLGDSDNDSDSAPYFPCHVCGKTFLTSESLEDHQRCHLGEKPFECEECGKCFFQLSNLQQHQRCHKSEFQCQMCGKGFVSLFALRKHKQTHVKKRPHRCTKCHLSFTRSIELAEHMVIHRDENFPCDLCDKTFSCKISRAEHRKIHTQYEEDLPSLVPVQQSQTKQATGSVPSSSLSPGNVKQYSYRCGICQVMFPDSEHLSEHGCNPAKERPYSCPECNKHFLHGSHLKKHQLSHQLSGPSSYHCNHCGISFRHHYHYLTHLQSHRERKSPPSVNCSSSLMMNHDENRKQDKIYQCPICPESFYQALDLANHLSIHSHMCSVCNMTFPTKQDLEDHEQCHLTAATQYECTECGSNFIGSDAFRRHSCIKSPSETPVFSKKSSGLRFGEDEEGDVDVGEDFIVCPICQKRFSSQSSFNDHHKNYHDDPRPFKCLICSKDFAQKRYLRQHQQTHSERPYKCDRCPESFKTEPSLVVHHKSHVNRHRCLVCNRSYSTEKDLLRHKIKHDESPNLKEETTEYKCDMCYKSFSMLSLLRKHQESHVGQIVYECTECDKAFAFLSLLEEHQQTHSVSSESHMS